MYGFICEQYKIRRIVEVDAILTIIVNHLKTDFATFQRKMVVLLIVPVARTLTTYSYFYSTKQLAVAIDTVRPVLSPRIDECKRKISLHKLAKTVLVLLNQF